MKEPAIPEKLDVTTGFNDITFTRKWLGWQVIPLAIFCVVWDSIIFVVYSSILHSKHPNWLAVLFPVGHIAVGLFLTYYVIATLFNRTGVSVSPECIRVKTYPIYWGSERRIKIEDITDTRMKSSVNNNNQNSFGVFYRNKENREKPIIRGGLTDDQAAYINFQIRKLIGLGNGENADVGSR